ncbi:MAG: hypothetical protein RIR97_1087, partial [Pseudomonadota bacterium]
EPYRTPANVALNQPMPRATPLTQPTNFNTSQSGARAAATPQRIERVALAAPGKDAITNSIAKPVVEAAKEKRSALAQPFPKASAVATKRDQVASATDELITGKRASNWSSVNAPSVQIKEGQTIASLAKRYGVPEKEILKANGLSSASAVTAGQAIIIPVYSSKPSVPAATPVVENTVAPVKAVPAEKNIASSLPVPKKVPVPVPAQEQALVPTTATLRDRNGKVSAEPKTASAAPVKAEQGARGTYQVQSGDSLAKIAKKAGVSIDALKSANKIVDKPIRVGQTLVLPGQSVANKAQAAAAVSPAKTAEKSVAAKPVEAKTAKAAAKPAAVVADTVKTGSIPPQKLVTAPIAQEAVKAPVAANGSVAEAAAKVDPDDVSPTGTGIGKYRWPVRGAVIAGYGANVDGNRNDGIDISVPEGTPVKAAENGVVIYSGNGLKELGNTVLIRHDDGTVTVYGNADKLNVARGEKVARGQVIANSGMSGNASRPKLHFEVRKNASAVNPMTFLD